MAPGRRDGAGWGRHAPAAPPPPASPSPTYWGRVLSRTATDLIQLLSNCLLYTQASLALHRPEPESGQPGRLGLGLVVTVTVIGSRPTVTPIIIMAAVVQKPWRYTRARALTTP